MTAFLIDLASYQQGIDLSLPAYDTWNLVNIKTSQGDWYVADRARSRRWADQARATGKGIMTFHWLDASTSGANQARIAYREMRELGGPDGMAHQADTEDDGKTYGPLTWRIWADYVNEMQQLMGRHVINYTGDWWWEPRGWDGAALTPYLMAAPNAGYLAGYPGDRSAHWMADYGGWFDLAAMQYHVGPIPGGGAGSSNVSQTAIRDPQVWAALTGGTVSDWSGLGAPKNFPYSGDVAAVDVQTVLRTGERTAWDDDDGKGWWIYQQITAIRKAADTAAAKPAGAVLTEADRAAIVADLAAALKPPTAAEVAAELIRQLSAAP